MTPALPPSKKPCPFCRTKVSKTKLISHLEAHADESYEEEQRAFQKTQTIRRTIEDLQRKK